MPGVESIASSIKRDSYATKCFKATILMLERGVRNMRKLLGRLLVEDNGQGLVEYTLIVLLVALVFWVAIKNTNIGSGLAAGWSKVTDCVSTPTSCNSSS